MLIFKSIQYLNIYYILYYDSAKESYIFWKKVSEGGKFWKNKPVDFGIEQKFAKYAIQILSIPCSESAVERVFSHLSGLLMSNKRNLSFRSINSILIIRMNSIFLNQKGKNTHDFILDDLDKLCNINFDECDPQFEDDPLVYF